MPLVRKHQDDRIAGIYVNVFDSEDEDEQTRYCESCKKNGFLRVLKSRLYLDDKGKAVEPEPDFESWRQCWTCGDIVKVGETRIESELSDVVEVEEANSSIKEPEVIPLFDKKRKGRLQKVREERATGSIKDPDVKQALKKGKHVENYQEFIPGE